MYTLALKWFGVLGITPIAVGVAGAESPDYLLDEVATDAHDYYAGHGEAPGQWIGSESAKLAMAGEVSRLEFGRVLSSNHPTTGDQLNSRAAATKVMGFDLTISAPKKVSLAWAMGDDRTRHQVSESHDAAVADAIGYLERNALRTRRGAGGTETIETGGFLGAAFRHRTSRAGDPDLHTHVAVANTVRGKDGKWSTIHGARIYAHGKTAGVIYQARLRHEITERLGFDFDEVTNGYADLSAISDDMKDHYSTRRAEIVAAMAERGYEPDVRWSARQAQRVAVDTRGVKAPHIEAPTELHQQWRAEAAAMGWNIDEMLAESRRHHPQIDPEALLSHLAGAEGLTEQRTSFGRRDVIQGLAAQMPAGATAEWLETQADDFLDTWGVQLQNASLTRSDVLHRGDGRVVTNASGEQRFTTTDLLVTEGNVVALGEQLRHRQAGIVEADALEYALRARPTMGDDQRAMVRAITTSGAGVEVVVAKAGTGKTYSVDAARQAWENSGFTVIGMSLSAAGAQELAQATGMPADTIASFLLQQKKPLPPRTVVVVDEAGMVGTRMLQQILQRRAPDTKVVLIGDNKQIPSIDAGGTYRRLSERLGFLQLTENRRFKDHGQELAADDLRMGRITEAMARYDTLELVHREETTEKLCEQMVANWAVERDGGQKSIMLADRVRDTEELNDVARALLRNQGRLGADELTTTSVSRRQLGFAVGDQVLLTKNERKLGVFNRQVGTVQSIDANAGSMTLRIDDRTVTLPATYINGDKLKGSNIRHGYALTAYKAQGSTVDHCHYFGSESSFREATYVSMSRAKQQNHFYVVDSEFDTVEKAINRSREHVTAMEQLRDAASDITKQGSKTKRTAWEAEAEEVAPERDPGQPAYEAVDDHDAEQNNGPLINTPLGTPDPGGAERRARRFEERKRQDDLNRERGDSGYSY